MTFVALSIPDWPTDAAASELLACLLAVAPRAAIAPGERLAWLDARGLDAALLVQHALDTLAPLNLTEVRAGIAAVPVVAAIAAHSAAPGHPRQIVPGTERAYLAAQSLDVLPLPKGLDTLFVSVGLVTCGDLAALDRAAVEVRFGPDGAACWRLARADDPRPIFSARPRTFPTASLDWTDFATADLEQLVFVLNALLGTICEALASTGLGARALTVTLTLDGGEIIRQAVGSARPTADRKTWLRLMRRALERITLPDRVAGIAVEVDAATQPPARQGDLFDFGFASEAAAENAVAQLLDLQGDAIVAAERTTHVLPERRVRWVADTEVVLNEGKPFAPLKATTLPLLSLLLLPAPREILVLTGSRRGFAVPLRYTDNGAVVTLRDALGPQCLSGGHWSAPFAREYYQGIRADGSIVLLYRDARAERWYLAGWWD